MGAIALPTILGVSAVSNVVGGVISADKQNDAIKSAATTQAAANMQAQDVQKEMYDATVARMDPFVQAGYGAVDTLESTRLKDIPTYKPPSLEKVASVYQTLPGYQERLQEGIRALDMSAAASGKLGGGGYVKALTRYGQDYATNAFNSTYSQMLQNSLAKYNAQLDRYNANIGNQQYLSSLGQNAAAMVGNAGANTASNISNLMSNTGAALANAQASQTSLLGTALQGVGNTGMNYAMLGNLGYLPMPSFGGGGVGAGVSSTASIGTGGGGGFFVN